MLTLCASFLKSVSTSISTLLEPNNAKSTVILWKLNTRNFFPTVRHDGFHYVRALAELFMFPALKSFFLSRAKPPYVIKIFFK
jgi:hypothetical protein